MEYTRLYTLLTYSGSLPFIACALLLYFGYTHIPSLGSVNTIAQTYGLVIVSFMSGVHWGSYLYGAHKTPVNLFLISNVFALVAWFSVLLLSVQFTFFVFILAFTFLLFIDYQLYLASLITEHYLATRRNVTVIVVISLFALIGAG